MSHSRVLLALVLLSLVPATITRSAVRPNVLFIAVDDLNDWIGCLGGHPDGSSPNIDALAGRGCLFTRSYCSAPACNPSRVAMMTGMRPSTTGIYVNPQPWRQVLKDAVTLPEVLESDLDDIPQAGISMAGPTGDHANILKTDNWRYAVQAYLASIRFADAQVGRLIQGLDKSQYAKNTIIVLWGDHGWHLGEKHHWRKFSLWEEACRAPLMIIAPGVTSAGAKCGRTVDFVDVYPTLSELCGLPIGEHLDGKSIVPLLKNPDREWNHPAITSHGRMNDSVRTERWRLIRYKDGSEELYDHDNDPMEWTNLAGQAEFADVASELAVWLPEKHAPAAPYDKANRKPRTQKNQRKTGKPTKSRKSGP